MNKHSHLEDPPSKIDIPITPILDLSFQLLFFFVVTYQPDPKTIGILHRGLPVTPPETASEKPDPNPPPSPKDPLEIKNKLTIVLKTNVLGGAKGIRGMINEISLASDFDADGNPHRLINSEDDKKSFQKAILGKWKEIDQKGQRRIVHVKFDTDLRFDEMVKIEDLCHEIDFQVQWLKPAPQKTTRLN